MENDTIQTFCINRKLGFEATTLEMLVCYNYVEGLIDKEETILVNAKEFICPIGTLAIADLCHVQSSDPSFRLSIH